jgi:protocatechuate 3,4-dioxygenase beta subunit
MIIFYYPPIIRILKIQEMKRRTFTKLGGLGAVAVTTTGLVSFDGSTYVGDCETTSDILGPFYRPGSPVRNNLVIEGEAGQLTQLSGIIRHKDCSTPYAGAKIELWHCSASEIYDNESDEFRYRGTTYCDENGKYQFTTQMPVPYDAGGGNYRPAHFHLLISAPGYQSLITQIYFVGDPYLKSDDYSANTAAKNRILEIDEKEGVKYVTFDCNLNDKLKASFDALESIVGTYKENGEGGKLTFFSHNGLLCRKNEVFGVYYDYTGNNEFTYSGMPADQEDKLHFELKAGGDIVMTRTTRWNDRLNKKVYYKH